MSLELRLVQWGHSHKINPHHTVALEIPEGVEQLYVASLQAV